MGPENTQRLGAKENFTETTALDYYGYIRTYNTFELDPLEDEGCAFLHQLHPENQDVVEEVILNRGFSPEDVPIVIDVPARPRSDISFEDMGLSIAELAGVAASVKLTSKSDTLFIGKTNHLGKVARRWFKTFDLPKEEDDQTDKWILKARGKEALAKLEKRSTLILADGRELLERHNVEFKEDQDGIKVKTGRLTTLFHNQENKWPTTTLEGESLSRTDLHVFRAFVQAYGTIGFLRSGKSPYMELQNEPLQPHSGFGGILPFQYIIETDRIQSYV